jgi:uncharacterized membrane protein
MTTGFEALQESIEIAVPPSVVFERWTRFEEYPQFMEGMSEVRRIEDRKLRWRGEFAGETREWDSFITVWIPGQKLAWRATAAGAHSSRAVSVEDAGDGRTYLTLKMLVDPDEAWAHIPNVDEISRRLKGDLARFKALLESSDRHERLL